MMLISTIEYILTSAIASVNIDILWWISRHIQYRNSNIEITCIKPVANQLVSSVSDVNRRGTIRTALYSKNISFQTILCYCLFPCEIHKPFITVLTEVDKIYIKEITICPISVLVENQ